MIPFVASGDEKHINVRFDRPFTPPGPLIVSIIYQNVFGEKLVREFRFDPTRPNDGSQTRFEPTDISIEKLE